MGNLIASPSVVDAGSGISIHTVAVPGNPGVSPFRSSAFTTPQDFFRRRGPTLTTNSSPHLQTFVLDAFGNPIPSTAFRAEVRRPTDSVAENGQNLVTNASGRLRWNYTIAATHPAFSRFVKPGSTRQTGSHVATGPDNPASPPATFSLGNSDHPADYPGPYPAYPRTVFVRGNAFGGVNEPSDQTTAVFGINSEIVFEDLWTGPTSQITMDANGAPTGQGQRRQNLGSGSLRAKVCTLIDEGAVTVIDPAEHNPKDRAGRNIVVTTDNLFGRRAIFNDTTDTIEVAAQDMSDAQTKLDSATGYNANNNSFTTIAAPTDPAQLFIYHAFADTTAQRTSFDLQNVGGSPVIGFTADAGNFGSFTQPVQFQAIDPSTKLLVVPEVVQSDPTLIRRYTIRTVRITTDLQLVAVNPDEAPTVWVLGVPSGGGALEEITTGSATAIGAEPTPNWFFDVTVPQGYSAVKIFATASVNGSQIIGGDVQGLQIGFEFDAVDFAAGIPFK